jgi:hypothetical protein
MSNRPLEMLLFFTLSSSLRMRDESVNIDQYKNMTHAIGFFCSDVLNGFFTMF